MKSWGRRYYNCKQLRINNNNKSRRSVIKPSRKLDAKDVFKDDNPDDDDDDDDDFIDKLTLNNVFLDNDAASVFSAITNPPEVDTNTAVLQYSYKLNKKIQEKKGGKLKQVIVRRSPNADDNKENEDGNGNGDDHDDPLGQKKRDFMKFEGFLKSQYSARNTQKFESLQSV